MWTSQVQPSVKPCAGSIQAVVKTIKFPCWKWGKVTLDVNSQAFLKSWAGEFHNFYLPMGVHVHGLRWPHLLEPLACTISNLCNVVILMTQSRDTDEQSCLAISPDNGLQLLTSMTCFSFSTVVLCTIMPEADFSLACKNEQLLECSCLLQILA